MTVRDILEQLAKADPMQETDVAEIKIHPTFASKVEFIPNDPLESQRESILAKLTELSSDWDSTSSDLRSIGHRIEKLYHEVKK
jgi:hypothetical protein